MVLVFERYGRPCGMVPSAAVLRRLGAKRTDIAPGVGPFGTLVAASSPH
jgi:hypothetical protein